MRTPMAPIFSAPTHVPVSPDATGGHAIVGADTNHHLFEIAHVPVHVAPIRPQIEDRVADDLTRTVIRHVAAAAGLVNRDAEIGELLVGRNDVGARDLAAHAEGDDGRMLQEQEQVGNAVGSTLLDERSLQRERLDVADQPETTDLECRMCDSSSTGTP